jgi:hypothetical protein
VLASSHWESPGYGQFKLADWFRFAQKTGRQKNSGDRQIFSGPFFGTLFATNLRPNLPLIYRGQAFTSHFCCQKLFFAKGTLGFPLNIFSSVRSNLQQVRQQAALFRPLVLGKRELDPCP